MDAILKESVKNIMSSDLITSHPNMLMTEVSELFEKHLFHHLPVLNEEGLCVGIISRSDYYQTQDKFTRIKGSHYQEANEKFMKSLLASEIMTPKPHTIVQDALVREAVNVFLENRVHSLVVTENEKCVGILTPHDVLSHLVE